MARKRFVQGEYPTKVEAQEAGRRAVNGNGRVDRIMSRIKKYEVKKVGKNWRLHLIEKTTYEMLGGKARR